MYASRAIGNKLETKKSNPPAATTPTSNAKIKATPTAQLHSSQHIDRTEHKPTSHSSSQASQQHSTQQTATRQVRSIQYTNSTRSKQQIAHSYINQQPQHGSDRDCYRKHRGRQTKSITSSIKYRELKSRATSGARARAVVNSRAIKERYNTVFERSQQQLHSQRKIDEDTNRQYRVATVKGSTCDG